MSVVSGKVAQSTLISSPCSQRVRAQHLAFSQTVRGNAIVSRIAEPRAQKMAMQTVCRQARGPPRGDSEQDAYEQDDQFQERVVQVRRVTKVVKGGKQLRFRAVVVIGDENGTVGVGCASAKEVVQAVRKSVVDAKRNLVTVPLTKTASFPHRFDGIAGSAKVMLRPASEGTGVIAGGAVRVVLELAGFKNAFGKQLGSDNPLNNARATVEGLKNMRTFEQVAQIRGLAVEDIMPVKV